MPYTGKLLKRYFWVLLGATVIAAALGLLWLGLTGTPPPAAITVLPTMAAAFDLGRVHKRWSGSALGSRGGAVLCALALAINAALYVFILGGAMASQGADLSALLRDASAFAAPVAIILLLFGVMTRVMIWFGARSVD